MRRLRCAGWVVVVMGAWVPMAWGGAPDVVSMKEVDALLNKLVERGVLRSQDVVDIKADMTAARTEVEAPATPESWVQRTTVSGDLRLRNEYRDRTNNTDANRQRVRFRYGFASRVTDQLEVGARLVTGSGSPISTNQTFDDTFEKKSIFLDLAYVTYRPLQDDLSAALSGGLIENPFWVPGDSQLLWDNDLTFAGLAAQTAYASEAGQLFLNTGIFPVDSDGFGTDNPSLWSVQGGFTVTPFAAADAEVLQKLTVTSALAYHDYKNTAKVTLENDQSGNNAQAEDFNELNPSFEVATKLSGLPIATWFDVVHNTSASVQENGFEVGARLGKAKKPWSFTQGWEAGYAFKRNEANAVLDALTQSTWGGSGTNSKGHAWWLKLATLKNSSLKLTVFKTTQVKGAKDHEDTVLADWVTKF